MVSLTYVEKHMDHLERGFRCRRSWQWTASAPVQCRDVPPKLSRALLCTRTRADGTSAHSTYLIQQQHVVFKAKDRHPFNCLFSRTTWVSRHQIGKPCWFLLEQEMMGWQWHQLDHMQIICTLLQTDNHASTSSLDGPDILLMPNQQCQRTEGNLFFKN